MAVKANRTGVQAPVRFTSLDEWQNAMTGLGQMLRDKKTSAKAVYRGLLTQSECEQIYAVDKLHRKIADKLPEDATRRWLELDIPDADDALKKNIQDEHDRLQIRQRVFEAWSAARINGGAALFINTGEKDEQLKEPLNPDKINSIINLVVLTRWELWCSSSDIETDIAEPNYGYPTTYELRPQGISKSGLKIHHTRLIRFDGEKLPEQLRRMNQYWHDSVFTGTYTALRNYGMSVSAAASLLAEFRQLYYYVKNLAASLGAGKKDVLRKRIEAQELARSVLGTFLLDLEEEKMESTSITLAGFADTLEIIKLALQANTEMPHTVLFNESPSGLGATGRSEQEQWYDSVSSQQEIYLSPKLDLLYDLIFRAKRGPTKGKVPEDWTYEYNPLWAPTDKEKAETEKLEAETAEIWIGNQVLESSEVREDYFPEKKQLAKYDPKTDPSLPPAAGNPGQVIPPGQAAPGAATQATLPGSGKGM